MRLKKGLSGKLKTVPFLCLSLNVYLPIDFRFSVCFQIIVCTAEMFVSKEAVVSRKRRGRGGSEYQGCVTVDKRSFLLSV